MNQIALRPTYWANVSGGKDSFYMLYLILQNLDKYPLDGVIHMELETDFPFIKDVIDVMESECKKYNIPFFRIKPRKSWEELYNKKFNTGHIAGFPTRINRWCNSEYKMDAFHQLQEMMQAKGKYVVSYIGFCADETKRFKYALNAREDNIEQIYPLAEMGIEEDFVLEWAKTQPIYHDYYKYNRRCGCICCPLSDIKSLAYTKLYYPEQFNYYMTKAKETEIIREKELGRPFSIWDGKPKYNTEFKIQRCDRLINKGVFNE